MLTKQFKTDNIKAVNKTQYIQNKFEFPRNCSGITSSTKNRSVTKLQGYWLIYRLLHAYPYYYHIKTLLHDKNLMHAQG